MYIEKVKITNYRNFGGGAFELELKPFTVILGENNIGKTNLLKALSLIFGEEMAMFRSRSLEVDDIYYGAVEEFRKQVINRKILPKDVAFPEVIVDVILTDLNDDQKAVGANWPLPTDSMTIEKLQITYRYAPSSRFSKQSWVEEIRDNNVDIDQIILPINKYSYRIYGGGDFENICDFQDLSQFKMDFLNALRDAERELVASNGNKLLSRVLLSRGLDKYIDLKLELDKLDQIVKENANIKSIKNNVEDLLDQISLKLKSHDNSVSFSFSSPQIAEILRKLSLIYGFAPIDIARNGLGRNNLLYLSLVLSQIVENNKSDIDEKSYFSLVAVEEPEAHLHPHLQDHLARNLEAIQSDHKEEMQFIVTTHSTHIASKLSLKNTVVMYEKEGKINTHYVLAGIDKDMSSGQLKKEDLVSIQYLRKYLDATKSRMFFAKKLILVEGISEQILIPLLFEKYTKRSIEEVSIEVINVNGIAFSHFLKIIKNGYFLRSVVLTDSDRDTKTENRSLKLKANYESENIKVQISETKTFEVDLIEANQKKTINNPLYKALVSTRPQSGQDFLDATKTEEDTETFFDLISDHKSEFALNLHAAILAGSVSIELPKYIKEGFDFLNA